MIRYTDLLSDTICAQITAAGFSGVTVLRVSGENSLAALRLLCPNLPDNLESHRCYLTEIFDSTTERRIDSVLISYFAMGQSFTGDEVVEISCHGNPSISQAILSLLFKNGCRLAEKGEFSFRAFYNGKIDLVQAESINSLIHSPGAETIDLVLELSLIHI